MAPSAARLQPKETQEKAGASLWGHLRTPDLLEALKAVGSYRTSEAGACTEEATAGREVGLGHFSIQQSS